MQKFARKLNKRGFTLIELIVVIAIIGILVTLAAPKFIGYTKDANVATMKADVKVLADAALQYNIDDKDSNWPTTSDEVTEGTTDLLEALGLDASEITFHEIDNSKLEEHYIKNISKRGYESYVIVTEGEYQGDVFSLEGIKDKEGNTWFGIDTEVEKVTP